MHHGTRNHNVRPPPLLFLQVTVCESALLLKISSSATHTTWKRTIPPTNPSCLDANANCVSQAWSFKLLGKPLFAEWDWLVCHELSSIHFWLAHALVVLHQPICKLFCTLTKGGSWTGNSNMSKAWTSQSMTLTTCRT